MSVSRLPRTRKMLVVLWLASFSICVLFIWVYRLLGIVAADNAETAISQILLLYVPFIAAICTFYFSSGKTKASPDLRTADKTAPLLAFWLSYLCNGWIVLILIVSPWFKQVAIEEALAINRQFGLLLSTCASAAIGSFFGRDNS